MTPKAESLRLFDCVIIFTASEQISAILAYFNAPLS